MQIDSGAHVRMHYRLFDERGELFDETDDEPVVFVHGAGDLPPGLEQALVGRGPGESLRVELEPDFAFGTYQPEGLISLPRTELPEDLTRDDVVPLVLTDDDGEELEDGELEVRVVEIRPDEVVLDANHPLAGQKVVFEVEIVDVTAG